MLSLSNKLQRIWEVQRIPPPVERVRGKVVSNFAPSIPTAPQLLYYVTKLDVVLDTWTKAAPHTRVFDPHPPQ
jgi:hypothetical protein